MDEIKENKIKKWLRENWILVAILIFAIALRFYYFTLTMNQPLWWDESEYMAAAKEYTGQAQYTPAGIRLPGFPMLMSSFFFLGIENEALMRFIALFLPSIFVILLIYLVIKEMYPDKRIAFISTAIMAVLWEHVFYSNRFHTENFALIFELLALYVLFKVYMKKQDISFIKARHSFLWITLFSLIAVIFRPGNVLFIPAVILFMAILNKDKIFSKKGTAIIAFSLILIAALYLIFPGMIQAFVNQYVHFESPIAWNVFSVFYGFYESIIPGFPPILYYAFLFGIFILLIDFIINFGKIKTIKNDSEELSFKSDIFNILLVLAVLAAFIFIIRPYQSFEFRWFFPLLPGMLAFTGKGIVTFSEYIGKAIKSKAVISILIIIILSSGLYTQIIHADSIIKIKLDSYSQVRDAALWMKENSNEGDKILSISYPQTAYYSERNVSTYSSIGNGTEFDNYLKINKPKFLEVSVFEKHPEWISDWIKQNNETIVPVKAYYLDNEKKQLALVIYEITK